MFQLKSVQEVNNITGTSVAEIMNDAQITTTTNWTLNIEDVYPSYVGHLPFDRVIIINNGEDAIYFDSNMNSAFRHFIPKGTIWVLESPNDIPAIHSWIISNAGTTTISASKISVKLIRKGMTTDNFTKAISKNVFFRALLGV